MGKKFLLFSPVFFACYFLVSCSYNPMTTNNHTTGNPAALGAGVAVGAGGAALAGTTKTTIAIAGITGGMLGYYLTTMRHDAANIIAAGGTVYRVGEYGGAYIPTDNIFAPNTDELLPQAIPILDDLVTIAKRFPNQNILISGNTGGFYPNRFELKLSEARAKRIASYLWRAGVNEFRQRSIETRKLNYVGYGDYFPVATHLKNAGIRSNHRIQVTFYPSSADLELDNHALAFHNIGGTNDSEVTTAPQTKVCTEKLSSNCTTPVSKS